jgi:hypothetical protein
MIFAQMYFNTTEYEIKNGKFLNNWLFYIIGYPNIQKIVKVPLNVDMVKVQKLHI